MVAKETIVEARVIDNLCLCGCGQETIFRRGKRNKYIHGHNGKKENNPFWKGGKYQDTRGYIYRLNPLHPHTNKMGYIPEHRLVYEEYYKCCLLPWIEIHHINNIKDDNRIENLQALTKSIHASISNIKDKSNRHCLLCLSPTTYTRRNRNNYEDWFHYKEGFICNKCYYKHSYKSLL